jgi:hypothetical protein
VEFRGAQFYPFPRTLARLLADAFPTFAFTIFFLIRKTTAYHEEFAPYPPRAQLATNIWTGAIPTPSQYWKPAG